MDDVGQTLLNWASAFGTQEMVRFLLISEILKLFFSAHVARNCLQTQCNCMSLVTKGYTLNLGQHYSWIADMVMWGRHN